MGTPIRTTGTLGPLLKRMRKAKKLSQAELGRQIGLSQERISTIESAPEKVTLDKLLTVMMALGAHFSVCESSPSENTAPATTAAEPGDW
ncbi:MAG: helix-turn-helix domain-containing protein [Pseudomonadota bacterium]